MGCVQSRTDTIYLGMATVYIKTEEEEKYRAYTINIEKDSTKEQIRWEIETEVRKNINNIVKLEITNIIKIIANGETLSQADKQTRRRD